MKEAFVNALSELRKSSKKRNFVQSVDLIIALRGLDLKKPTNRFEEIIVLPHKVREPKIAIFVGKELEVLAKKFFDVISIDKFKEYSKSEIRKLVKSYDFFIAQANIMGEMAKYFGKKLASQKKMPNPKLGTIVPPNANEEMLKKLKEKLSKVVIVKVKKQPNIQVKIGNEKMEDEKIAENALTVYDKVLKRLPNGKSNIKRVYVKFTMSKPVEVKINGS